MKKIKALGFLCAFAVLLTLSACFADSPQTAEPPPSVKSGGDISEEWITTSNDSDVDMSGMNLYSQRDNLQFAADEDAILSIYVRADKNENGDLAFDDGQDWLVVIETALGNFTLFPRQYVQLGGVSCAVFNDYAEDDTTIAHVLVTVRQTAGLKIYDCVFDSDKEAFKLVPVYEAKGINFITETN